MTDVWSTGPNVSLELFGNMFVLVTVKQLKCFPILKRYQVEIMHLVRTQKTLPLLYTVSDYFFH